MQPIGRFFNIKKKAPGTDARFRGQQRQQSSVAVVGSVTRLWSAGRLFVGFLTDTGRCLRTLSSKPGCLQTVGNLVLLAS
mgnify:CR=1 FL=1